MSMASEVYEMNLEETVHKQKAEIAKLKYQYENGLSSNLEAIKEGYANCIEDKDTEIAKRDKQIIEAYKQMNADHTRNMDLQDKLDEKNKQIAELVTLAKSVMSSTYEIYCDDVNGCNWFDKRDELTHKHKPAV